MRTTLLTFGLAILDLLPLWAVASYHQALHHPHVFTDSRVAWLYGSIGMVFVGMLYLFSAYNLGEAESFYQLAPRVMALGVVMFAVLPLFYRLIDLRFSAKAVVTIGAIVPFYLAATRWLAFRWIWIPSTQLRVWWISDNLTPIKEFQMNSLFNGHHRLIHHTQVSDTVPSRLGNIALQKGINAICVDFDWRNRKNWIQSLVSMRLLGFEVRSRFEWIEELQKRIDLNSVNEDWFLHAEYRFQNSLVELRLKRTLDFAVSALVLLLVVIPLGLVLAVLNVLINPGPLFYTQARVGHHGDPFKIYKFRSMVPEAEDKGARWAAKKDTRVPWLGQLLRRSHFDEMPQFWNILKGEMSLVGPRPERPEFVDLMEQEIPFYRMRHYVKPGLTGWAQINSLYADSIESSRKKLEYDLYYMSRLSFPFEMWIIVNTFRNVLFAKGR